MASGMNAPSSVGAASRSRGVRVRGFSLIEMMLVVLIIGVLITVVLVSVGGQGERAKIKATEAKMSQIESAIKQYHLEQSAYPVLLANLQTARPPYLDADRAINDAWKRDFYYKAPGRVRDFDLVSAGNDGEFGSEDDIDVWNIGK